MKKTLLASFFAFALLTVSAGSAHAATMYWYNSGADAQWTTRVGNWWTNVGHSSQAGSLPGAGDAVVTMAGSVGPQVNLDIWTQPASINASLTGITFNSSSYHAILIGVTGSTTFAGTSVNSGTVTGTTTFNGSGWNQGSITGTTTFNDLSFNNGTIIGIAVFNNATGGIVTVLGGGRWGNGTATSIVGHDLQPISEWIFNGGSSNQGPITGSTTFDNGSYNSNTIHWCHHVSWFKF